MEEKNNNKQKNGGERQFRHNGKKHFGPRKQFKGPKKPFEQQGADGANDTVQNEAVQQTKLHDTKGFEVPEFEAVPEVEEVPKVEIVGIKFRNSSKAYYFAPNGIEFKEGEAAIVETVRGVEYGSVTIGNKYVSQSEIIGTLKPVLRKADENDTKHFRHNCETEELAKPKFLEAVNQNKLQMQLVDVEYTFDNAKLIFYFTADGRVDFRDLVRDLASIFRTRIELRQIGVRDEAKLIGGIGVCGRPFCCKTFLSDFTQVSIKMAKEQNLSLSSSKISGTCGRLMCCLRFEQDTYEREYATFPKVDSIIEAGSAKGVIVESNFLTGKIKARMEGDAPNVLRTYTKDDVKVIGRVKNSKDDRSDELPEGYGE